MTTRFDDREAVHHELVARLDRFRSNIGERLQPAFDELMDRRGFAGDNVDTYFHPLGQPIVELPLWMIDTVDPTGVTIPDEVALDLFEAGVVGYLHARLQDDFFDERIGEVATTFLLSDACLVRFQRLVAGAVGSSERFWDVYQEVAYAYGDALLLETELHAAGVAYDSEQFDLVLRRSHPLVLTALAALDRADRWELMPEAREFVRAATRAVQIVDDLQDCFVDVANGNLTWVAHQLGGAEGAEGLMIGLLAGKHREVIEGVENSLQAALQSAERLKLAPAVARIAYQRELLATLADHLDRGPGK